MLNSCNHEKGNVPSSRVKSITMEEIIVVKSLEGAGTDKDPFYCVLSYWTKDGTKIGEIRPMDS